MISVQNISKTFGKVTAVENVSLEATDGKITALLGANGAGKTTSMRMIYALIKPESGQVLVDGINTHDSPVAARAKMGVLPDARGLYKRLTARENIVYFGRLQGMTEQAIKDRSEELIECLGMASFINRRTDGFSQGQRVKVAIARSLLSVRVWRLLSVVGLMVFAQDNGLKWRLLAPEFMTHKIYYLMSRPMV